MSKNYKLGTFILALLTAIIGVIKWLGLQDIPVLKPKGLLGQQEAHLITLAAVLSLVVVIPVYGLTLLIAWRYREGNTKAKYSPELDHSLALETVWWLIPIILITTLSIITWRSSHQLDPFRSIDSSNRPMTIQVVALEWKWLFIYPEQKIATVNYVQFPVSTPIDFEITADAPMNSFWIPGLGGQIYAMSGMSTHLHLTTDESASFRGSSANISGIGFAGMNFVARSTSADDFDQWVRSVKQSDNNLDWVRYKQLAKPTQNNQPISYSTVSNGLYDNVLMKYMLPDNYSINRFEPADSNHRSMQGRVEAP